MVWQQYFTGIWCITGFLITRWTSENPFYWKNQFKKKTKMKMTKKTFLRMTMFLAKFLGFFLLYSWLSLIRIPREIRFYSSYRGIRLVGSKFLRVSYVFKIDGDFEFVRIIEIFELKIVNCLLTIDCWLLTTQQAVEKKSKTFSNTTRISKNRSHWISKNSLYNVVL